MHTSSLLRSSPARAALALAALALPIVPFAACSSSSSETTPAAGATTSTSGSGGAGGVSAGAGGSGGGGAPVSYPACQGPDPKGEAFSDGPSGTASRDLAGDFTVPTLDGDWSFRDSWTGCDSYVFVMYAAGYDYAEDLWTSSTTKLLSRSPPNVHYFFLSYAQDDDAQVATDVQKMKSKMDVSLGSLTDEERASWAGRMHYVTKGAWDMDNWITDMLKAKGVFSFAIDRLQRVREVGLLMDVASGSQKAKLEFLGDEASHFNFEWQREQDLAAEKDVTVIPVLTASTTYDADIELPDAATMAGFDTLEIDVAFNCTDHLDDNCGEWDYIANLFLCDEVDEASCPTELARWITTYHREGRWVTDVSPMLAMLKGGGTRHLHLNPANSYVVDMSFRLMNRGKGSTPDEATYLFSGGSFNEVYNDAYAPLTFEVPADVKRVEIAALITGHGWGTEADNCAEFCNHDHHFTINGTDFVKDHPMAGTSAGCRDQVVDGSIPNQYGTWPLGRGGWCPGLDVKPWVVDITDKVVIGGSNTLTYQGLFKGETYVPKPGDPNSGGFGANINMTSWLVYSR